MAFKTRMSDDIVVQTVLACIPDPRTFARMRDIDRNGIDESMTYPEFFQWNDACVKELPYEEVVWLIGLSRRILKRKIFLIDTKISIPFEANWIFFDMNKNLCIFNKR